MKNLKYLVLLSGLFFFAENIFSQANNIIPNGYNKFLYGDGKVSSEGPMRDGKPDGYWKTYYVNGKIKSEGNRKNFQLDSSWLFYDEAGNVTKIINYQNDKKNGYYQEYKLVNDSGVKNVLISKELYVNDLKQGTSYYYYTSGKIQYQINYQNNLKQGNGLEYDHDGMIISEMVYRNDITVSKNRINRYDRANVKAGTWKYYHENGNIKTEAYYKNGKLNGYVKEYDEKGKLISSKRYVDNELYVENEKLDEKAIVKKEFYANGKVKATGSFKKDVPVGQHTTFSEAGEIIDSKNYSATGWIKSSGITDKKGNKQGQWKYFFQSGKVKSEGEYKNDRRIGDWVFYYENGTKEQSGSYDKRGQEMGLWTWYHDNGNSLREEEFTNGVENGKMVEYSRSGDIVSKGNYVEGVREGPWYFSVGDEIQEGDFKAGLKDGIWKTYYPDKTLMSEGRYVDDEENGKFKYYYPNGKIKIEAEYSMGKRHNEWKFYSEEGILYTTITYQLDEEIKIDGKKIEVRKS